MTFALSSAKLLTVLSRALGCVYGNWVGDAAGAVLEFMHIAITPAAVQEAMGMPGRNHKHTSNVMQVGRGQITDDGELTLSILNAAAEAFALSSTSISNDSPPVNSLLSVNPSLSPSDALLIENVAIHFKRWIASEPFDIGITTRIAFSGTKTANHPSLTQALTATAASACSESQSNGSLMRCSPLAIVLGPSPSVDRVKHLTHAHAALSHPTTECRVAEFFYILAINHLIFHPDDAAGALQLVQSKAAERLSLSSVDDTATASERTVLKWLLEESMDTQGLDCRDTKIGWVKWGFVLAFYHLRKGSSFVDAIADTLMRGGDTDTNAAIVGALIGARWGVETIPRSMIDPVREAEEPRISRPEFLIPRQSTVELIVSSLITQVTQ